MKLIHTLSFLFIPLVLFCQNEVVTANRVISEIDSSRSDNMVLRQTFEINAHIDKVWEANTTKQGWESWAVPIAQLDFRIGGLIETHYDKNAKIGDPNTIRLHVVNFVPKKMITLQAELTEHFPSFMKKDAKNLFNLIYFEQISSSKTKVISYGIGYKNNEKYLELMKFFIAGNEATYVQLISYLETGVPWQF